MFLSVIVIARDGNWTPSNGAVYGVFLACVLCHAILASTTSRIMGKLQTVFVIMNFVLIFATIIALPIGKARSRNSGHYVFAQTENLTTWPTGWAFMLAWLSPIWTIGSFDSCVHISEEAANATKAVPYGILVRLYPVPHVWVDTDRISDVHSIVLVVWLHLGHSNSGMHESRPGLDHQQPIWATYGAGELDYC